MTVTGLIENRIAVPEGVSVSCEGREVGIKGPKGTLKRRFTHPRVDVSLDGGELVVRSEYPRTAEKSMVGTYTSHLNNMLYGVTEGHEYQLKVVYSHFPMKVTLKGKQVQIDNYQGGKAPRFADILGETQVKISGADLTVSGPDIEACGQTAANIERAASRRGFDTRVFQDGIYIVKKSQRVVE